VQCTTPASLEPTEASEKKPFDHDGTRGRKQGINIPLEEWQRLWSTSKKPSAFPAFSV
jgi:hypothetical protein